jgi:hypothetical protein
LVPLPRSFATRPARAIRSGVGPRRSRVAGAVVVFAARFARASARRFADAFFAAEDFGRSAVAFAVAAEDFAARFARGDFAGVADFAAEDFAVRRAVRDSGIGRPS